MHPVSTKITLQEDRRFVALLDPFLPSHELCAHHDPESLFQAPNRPIPKGELSLVRPLLPVVAFPPLMAPH
ncbi:TPA: hypothetical protein EYP26_02260 [Candidatus Bathyarchaeota archaeon]|nr:hypothetical protein [Candidatus Bathyarchaeota archaeon]